MMDYHDYKWEPQSRVEVWETNQAMERITQTAVISQTLDEMLQLTWEG